MTAPLTAAFLSACGLGCPEVVLDPPADTAAGRGRVHVRGADQDAWLDVHPVQAVCLALHVQPNVAMWIAGGERGNAMPGERSRR
jgi:hypothetical protein